MNRDKTKVISTEIMREGQITIDGETIGQVTEFVYLGQILRLDRQGLLKEVERRIQLGWAAFGKLKFVLLLY